jgi:hypothetical protein
MVELNGIEIFGRGGRRATGSREISNRGFD